MCQRLFDQLLAGYQKPEDRIGKHSLLKQLAKAAVERARQAEMKAHFGHTKNSNVTKSAGNTRNVRSSKTLKDEFGERPIEMPCDRHGSFAR